MTVHNGRETENTAPARQRPWNRKHPVNIMNMLKIMLISLVMSLPALAAEDMALLVAQKAEQVKGSMDLGALQVEGVGVVKLTATREGTLLVVQAIGAEGKVIGRAESTIGLKETPIYVTTPKGLKKLTVMWNGP